MTDVHRIRQLQARIALGEYLGFTEDVAYWRAELEKLQVEMEPS